MTATITVDDLSARLSVAASAILQADPALKGNLSPEAWQAAAREAGLPRLRLPNDPVAIAIHTYAVAIISERQGKRPTEQMIAREVAMFGSALMWLNLPAAEHPAHAH
jgi:hypothetical protein